jgi:hypothetical protein
MAKYKPGQFVSFGGKLCRVKRYQGVLNACFICKMWEICMKERLLPECKHKLGQRNYPEPISKPKRQG